MYGHESDTAEMHIQEKSEVFLLENYILLVLPRVCLTALGAATTISGILSTHSNSVSVRKLALIVVPRANSKLGQC